MMFVAALSVQDKMMIIAGIELFQTEIGTWRFYFIANDYYRHTQGGFTSWQAALASALSYKRRYGL